MSPHGRLQATYVVVFIDASKVPFVDKVVDLIWSDHSLGLLIFRLQCFSEWQSRVFIELKGSRRLRASPALFSWMKFSSQGWVCRAVVYIHFLHVCFIVRLIYVSKLSFWWQEGALYIVQTTTTEEANAIFTKVIINWPRWLIWVLFGIRFEAMNWLMAIMGW